MSQEWPLRLLAAMETPYKGKLPLDPADARCCLYCFGYLPSKLHTSYDRRSPRVLKISAQAQFSVGHLHKGSLDEFSPSEKAFNNLVCTDDLMKDRDSRLSGPPLGCPASLAVHSPSLESGAASNNLRTSLWLQPIKNSYESFQPSTVPLCRFFKPKLHLTQAWPSQRLPREGGTVAGCSGDQRPRSKRPKATTAQ